MKNYHFTIANENIKINFLINLYSYFFCYFYWALYLNFYFPFYFSNVSLPASYSFPPIETLMWPLYHSYSRLGYSQRSTKQFHTISLKCVIYIRSHSPASFQTALWPPASLGSLQLCPFSGSWARTLSSDHDHMISAHIPKIKFMKRNISRLLSRVQNDWNLFDWCT